MYSNRRQAALGIKPRAPRVVSSGQQRASSSDPGASSTAHAKLVPAVDATGGATHARDGEDAETMEAEVAAPGASVSTIKSLRVSVRNSPCLGDAGDAKAAKKRSRSSSGDLLVSSDNGEAGTVPATAKKTKLNGVAASKTPE